MPTFLGEPRLQKPPLLHWLQAALFEGFGPLEFLARLPAAVATLGSLAILGIAARRRFGPEAAVWAVAALATMPLVFLVGRSGTTDALLAVHVLAAVRLDLAPPEEERKGRALLFGALVGMAFLAKGPVGVLLPVLVVLAGRTAAGREVWPGWRAVAKAVAAAPAVAAPWGLAIVSRVGWPAIRDLLATELGARIAEGAGHPEPEWYYVAVFPVVTLPWGLVVARAFVRAVAEARDPASRTARYAAAGLAAGIVLLSLSRGKLPSYLLPLLPLAALLVAREVGESLRRAPARVLAPLLVAAKDLIGLNMVHLPTVKTHVFTTITGAMKNAFGGLLHRNRHWTHAVIHDTLVDLLMIPQEIHPGLFAVMDGTFAGDGPGPRAMRWHEKDILLASADQVAIDAVSARLQGFDPMQIRFLRRAHELGLGVADPRQIKIVGHDIEREPAWGFRQEDTFASWGQKLIYHGPLKPFENLQLQSPLVPISGGRGVSFVPGGTTPSFSWRSNVSSRYLSQPWSNCPLNLSIHSRGTWCGAWVAPGAK